MSLARFTILTCVDSNNGISKRGEIPWIRPGGSSGDLKFFRDKTIGKGKNVVIMGRKTYESLPDRPLEDRINIVISRSWKQSEHSDIRVFPTFIDALTFVGSYKDSYEETFVIGGEQIYIDVIRDFLYLCNSIIVTKLKTNYECDKHFPFDSVKNLHQERDCIVTRDYYRYFFAPRQVHPEIEYLNVLRKVFDEGENRSKDEESIKSIFGGITMRFNITERCPIITTKKMSPEKLIQQMIWMVQGRTDSKWLEDKGNTLLKRDTCRGVLNKKGLTYYEEGDCGPISGFQMRHWGCQYKGCSADYTNEGTDQLNTLITNILTDPFSQHIFNLWNISDKDKLSLPLSQLTAMFNVSQDRRYLDCQVYIASANISTDVPAIISVYGIFTHVLAHICGMYPRGLSLIIGDGYINITHTNGIKRVLSRTPRPWATLHLSGIDSLPSGIGTIDKLSDTNLIVKDYDSWEYITFD